MTITKKQYRAWIQSKKKMIPWSFFDTIGDKWDIYQVLAGEHKDVILLQYTECFDLHERLICEGDILLETYWENDGEEYWYIGVVCFQNDGFKFLHLYEKSDDPIGGSSPLFEHKNSTVIGNIFENKELLDPLNRLSISPNISEP